MKTGRFVSAALGSASSAEAALTRLRDSDIARQAISILSAVRDEPDHQERGPDNKASGALKGLGFGAGVGALFGLAALVVPGVGPFIAAGALAETFGIIGSAVVSGAAVGGAAGGLSGALMKYGMNEEEARFAEERVARGAYIIAVDTERATANRETVEDILQSAGGELHARTRMDAHAS